jgi:YidC/Oxa1 family membrane protein insertase
MDQNDQRNFLIAIVLTVVFLFAYQSLVLDPAAERQRAQSEARQQLEGAQQVSPDGDPSAGAPVQRTVDMEEALAADDRIIFDAGAVDGSIRLKGARLDDLSLKRHRVTVEEDAPEVRLLSPENTEFGYYGFLGWIDATDREDPDVIAGSNTSWSLASGSTLTDERPVTLELERGGLRISREISVDDNYMFSFTDTVRNTTGAEIVLQPVSAIRRYGDWKAFLEATDPGSSRNLGLVHTGVIGVLDGSLEQMKYNTLQKGKKTESGTSSEGGWWGFTDKYWMTTIVPPPNTAFEARSSYTPAVREPSGRERVETQVYGQVLALAPGEEVTVTNRLFAGAKELDVLQQYEKDLGVPRFNDAVDWGRFYFLTKPFFWALKLFQGWVSGLGAVSFGVAILILTVVIKAIFFPLQNKAYASMSKMKKLTEPMKEIRERFAADKQRQQQEIMKLYQKEKVNPLAGCLPILIQIPIFFALYKTLIVTIEMRHAPFFGWINDLSAPDPTAIGNLFGLLGGLYTAADVKSMFLIGAILGVGAWPILYGLTMWGVQSLNPPPPDPMQRKIFMFLPIVLTFVFAGFAAGLVIYWTWSNVLSLIQQYVIMRRQGVDTQLDKLIRRLRQPKAEVPPGE